LGNYYLKYLATDKLSLTLNVKHAENRNNGTFPLTGTLQDALDKPYTLNQNNVAEMVDNLFNTSLSVNYTGTGFNFTSQSAYQSNYRYYKQPIDADFSPLDGYAIVNNYGSDWNNVKVLTQEFRFSSAAASASPLKWVAGTYMYYQNTPVKQGTHIGKDGLLLGAPTTNFTSITTNKGKSQGIAAFAQGTYTIQPKLDLILGLRYDYEHKKQNIMGEFQPDEASATVTRTDTSSAANFYAFTPKAGLQYHAGANNELYGTYSRGFRAGGISQLSGDPREALVAYQPEFSNNFEVGSKNTFFENKLRLNVSLFYTVVNNAQVPTLILPDAITVTRNAGKLNSKGGELELAATPFKALELTYNLGYTDAKYTSLNVSSNGAAVNYNNNRQIFTPNLTSMLALQYGYDLGRSYKLTARGEWHYIGKQYFDLANQVQQNGYHLFNARLGVASKNYEFFVWGSNITNKKYVDYAYDFGAAHLGNPKTYGATVRVNF
jgi:iron complex outermembrane receptor protein